MIHVILLQNLIIIHQTVASGQDHWSGDFHMSAGWRTNNTGTTIYWYNHIRVAFKISFLEASATSGLLGLAFLNPENDLHIRSHLDISL